MLGPNMLNWLLPSAFSIMAFPLRKPSSSYVNMEQTFISSMSTREETLQIEEETSQTRGEIVSIIWSLAHVTKWRVSSTCTIANMYMINVTRDTKDTTMESMKYCRSVSSYSNV